MKAFHIYKEVYTINLGHVHTPPQKLYVCHRIVINLKNAMDTHQKGKFLYS